MKKFLLLLILLCCTSVTLAAPLDKDSGLALLDKLSTDDVNNFIVNINNELHEDLPLLTVDSIKGFAAKGLTLNWQEIWQLLIAKIFKELTINLHLMGKLLFLAVLCTLLQNLQNSFEHSGIALLAYSLCFVFLAVIALNAFYNALSLVNNAVNNMVGFMQALLPLLISLLAGVGALTSAALFTPLMLFVISSVSVIIKDVVLPLLFLTAALECVNSVSDKYKLSNLAGVLKQAGVVVMGITLVIFIGIISIQGVAGGIADGLTLRTAKYATSTFIPVVGGMFADAVELVMGASLIIKNSIGIFGVITIGLLCLTPIIKLLSLVFVVKLTGALIQPMGDEKMAKCLDAMGNTLLLVLGALLTVALMFFLAITMIIGAGSFSMMLR